LQKVDKMKKILLFSLLAAILLVPIMIVLANSAPPPSVVWFTFTYETKPAPRLVGVQLVGCPTPQCAQPVLLQQFGVCNLAGCLAPPAILTGFETSFGCAGDRCRSTAYPNHGEVSFKLVAQFSDRTRSSPVTSQLPSDFREDSAWKVIVRDSDLALTPDTTLPQLNQPPVLHSLLWLGMSVVVELVVAVAGFNLWAQSEKPVWSRRLLVIFLVNLATLPAVWLFFPSFGRFQSVGSRYLGIIALIFSAFYAALLIVIYRSPRKVRRWAIPLIVMTGMATTFGCLFLLALAYFGGSTVYIQGLSSILVITLSEVYAVIIEAILISILCKQPLSTRWIWITSLLMNAASFIVGVIIIGR
jgi:hypothetical protein